MKELLLRIVSPLLAIFGYKKDEEPAREDDQFEQFEHHWRDIGGEG